MIDNNRVRSSLCAGLLTWYFFIAIKKHRLILAWIDPGLDFGPFIYLFFFFCLLTCLMMMISAF